jgi:hypothetical protein
VTGSGQAIQGSNPNTVVLKLFMQSLEYQRIYNFPQNGVQFIAELGGLMCFFLGSIFQNFISAENFWDKFSSSNFGKFQSKNNIEKIICVLLTIIFDFKVFKKVSIKSLNFTE